MVNAKLTDAVPAAQSLINELATAVPLAQATIPGKRSRATRWRWALHGILRPDGTRIKLKTHRIGGRIFVTPAAVAEFIAALSSDQQTPAEPDAAAASRGRDANAALASMGY